MSARADAETAGAGVTSESPFTRIICAVDGSPTSLLGIERAQSLAPKAAISAVAVLDPRDALPTGVSQARARCEGWLQEAAHDFPDVDLRVIAGRAVESLGALATDEGADLIVVGASRSSQQAGLLHRSVTTGLGYAAPCSLLVARPSANFPEPIVLASDGSRTSLDATDLAADLAAASGRESVVLINVGDGAQAPDLSEHAVRILERTGTEAVVVMADGDPARQIADIADHLDAGLVVVGSRGLNGLRRLGSVSERVLHRAGSSVLVVRHPHDREEHRELN